MIKYLTVDLLGEASPERNSLEKQVTVEELLDRASKKIENNAKLAACRQAAGGYLNYTGAG